MLLEIQILRGFDKNQSYGLFLRRISHPLIVAFSKQNLNMGDH